MTARIEDLERDESDALLEQLFSVGEDPDIIYEHVWQSGDLVMWDNRTLLHRANANYGMNKERRILHRTVIKGDDIPH